MALPAAAVACLLLALAAHTSGAGSNSPASAPAPTPASAPAPTPASTSAPTPASASATASAPAPAPAPASAQAPAADCIASASSLIDCMGYVSPDSTEKSPSRACCGEVKAAVANPAVVDCLCALAGSKNLGIPIDMKRVASLPGACGASNFVSSKCHISAGSPTEAPGASAEGSPSGGATASPPKAAASSRMTATALMAAVVAPLLAYCYLL